MSPSYRDNEQYERWHVRDCARCGRRAAKAANWSDGPICRTCLDRALRVRGRCPTCAQHRLLPGRDEAGAAICRDCAGITRDFYCDRCGHEGALLGGRLCQRCTLSDRLDEFLDDGTGNTNPDLKVLRDVLLDSGQPKSRLMWLRSAQVRSVLRDLATGRILLTHDALGEHPSWRTVIGVRDLLIASGVLPPADRRLLLYQRWLAERLEGVGDREHARLLQRFACWHQLRRLHTAATAGPLSASGTNHARQEIQQAGSFLTWLTGLDVDLIGCRQNHLDAWHAERFASRRPSRAFLLWCITSGQLPRLHVPTRSTPSPAPPSRHRRTTMLRQALTEQELPLQLRVVASLLLLYAQPVTCIVRLTTKDVTDDAHGLTLRLGSPPSPIPAPLDHMIREHLQQVRHRTPASRWLFPRRRADQPAHPTTLLDQVRAAGIPAGQTRITTLRQLVLQAPPPVIAQTLGYHHTSTARVANQAGSTWSQYAPGDHDESPPTADDQHP